MHKFFLLAIMFLVFCWEAAARTVDTNSPVQVLTASFGRVVRLLSPNGNTNETFTATLKLNNGSGPAREFVGTELEIALRAPDHVRLSGKWQGQHYALGRAGNEVWAYAPDRKFGVVGQPGIAAFAGYTNAHDMRSLGPLVLPIPIPIEALAVLPVLTEIEPLGGDKVGGVNCLVYRATPREDARKLFNLLEFSLKLWIRDTDFFPLRIEYRQVQGPELDIDLVNPAYQTNFPAASWQLKTLPTDHVEVVARSHLVRFFDNLLQKLLPSTLVPLPVVAERKVLARENGGRLENIQGTRVLFLKGTPEEMGRQHGILLKKEINSLVEQVVYGVGVGSSFEKGRWFFDEIQAAQKRLAPFVSTLYVREMDAIAAASGIPRQEVQLANFFPELFHCSGVAVWGKATATGRLYHGRVLDYLRGFGLEQNAVIIVMQPAMGNAWVNVGYAGFVGSVTAMNEKGIAIGEMGGGGEGKWDGKPMAQLVREVMERASTLEEAVKIMRESKRTCEYYYVISDGKARKAVGIAATPDKFETVYANQAHPQLPHPVEDAVLLSAGNRYEELVRRVRGSFGKIDATIAWDLMKKPVCMDSNIQTALFSPETLDFWVANATGLNEASHARVVQYNLGELLQKEN